MKKIHVLIFLIIGIVIITFLLSCENEDDATKVVITFKSGASSQLAEQGTKIIYEIEAYSIKSNLKEFTISSFDSENGSIVLIDTVLNLSKFFYSFVYDVPEFQKDLVNVSLKIRATDFDSNSNESLRQVIVMGGNHVLQPVTGVVLNSSLSGKPDAFSLENPNQVFFMSVADSIITDVYDNSFINLYSDSISRKWCTKTDVKFAKINSFNYASATSNSIKSTYTSLVKQKYIENIEANDVIIVGRNDEAWGVIQMTDVVDNKGTENDYYRFDIKIIK